MRFKQFMETHSTRSFLVSALELFPDSADILVLADAMEEEGDPLLAQVIRTLIQNRVRTPEQIESDPKDEWIVEQTRIARKRLRKYKIDLHDDSMTDSKGDEYHWHGKAVAVSPRSGSSQRKVLSINDIKREGILKGLAVLAAIFFAQSSTTHYGLDDYRTTKGVLNRQGKELQTVDSELRFAIKNFLIYFRQFEELVTRLNRYQRRSQYDLVEAQRLINYRHYGYLWQIPLTTHVVREFVQGKSAPVPSVASQQAQFLARLAQRIRISLQIIPDSVNADEKMVNDLRQLADIMAPRT